MLTGFAATHRDRGRRSSPSSGFSVDSMAAPRRRWRIGMNETIQAIVDLVTAAGVIYLAVRMERFIGRVEGVEKAHNAHVNAPGMHGR